MRGTFDVRSAAVGGLWGFLAFVALRRVFSVPQGWEGWIAWVFWFGLLVGLVVLAGSTGRRVRTPYGSTDIDVVLRDGTFIEVGGPAKALNLSKFGQQLQRVQYAAQQAGGRAVFMYDDGTPQAAIDLARKWFGEGGARRIG